MALAAGYIAKRINLSLDVFLLLSFFRGGGEGGHGGQETSKN